MEYLITDAQLRQLHQSSPPTAVQEVLSALPPVEKVSVDTDRTRRDEVSVWSALALALPRVLKVGQGSWIAKVCSGIYSIGSEIGGFLTFIGVAYGCVWGVDYIQSQWGSGLTAGMAATFVALTVAAIGAAAGIIRVIKILVEKDSGDAVLHSPLSGHLITELQIQRVFESSPPGYVMKMLDSLPVTVYFEKCKTQPAEVEASAIEPESIAPDPRKWWGLPVGMIILLSLLWLAFGSLLSEDPDTMATIGAYAILGTVLNVLVCMVWARRNERLIAQRAGLTW